MPLQNDIHLNPPQLLKSYPLLPLQTASPGIIARTSTQAKSGYFAKIILQLRIFPWICMHITKPALPNHYQQFFLLLPYFNLCAINRLEHCKTCECWPMSLFIVMNWGYQLSEMSTFAQGGSQVALTSITLFFYCRPVWEHGWDDPGYLTNAHLKVVLIV